MGSLPAYRLARFGRASVTYSSRRPTRPCVFSARLRRCEPPPSQLSIEALCPSTSAPTVLPAAEPSQLARSFKQPCLQSAPQGAETFNVENRAPTPWLTEPPEVRSLKARGPSCLQPRAWRRPLSPSEGAALGRRRFAPPCRARSRAALPSLTRRREHCDPYSQQMP